MRKKILIPLIVLVCIGVPFWGLVIYVDIIEGTVPHLIQFDDFTIAAGESKIITLSIPSKYTGIVQIESEKELHIHIKITRYVFLQLFYVTPFPV